MKRRYAVLIERGPKSFGASVPDLPGCVAVAKSRRAVLKLIAEAMHAHVAVMHADGEVVPEPVHEAVVVEVAVDDADAIRARPAYARPQFERYIGIDYSGAQTPTSSLKGLRVFAAEGTHHPTPVEPPPSLKRYWTRRGLAEWLATQLAEGPPTIVGIDHGFSFPEAYFRRHRLPRDWRVFLADFHAHWPTDGDHVYVDFVRDGARGHGAARSGVRTWRRVTEVTAGAAKSVFHFDVQGQVAKSTHAGLPWLKFLLEHPTLMGTDRMPFMWPFDGWEIPRGRSALVEVYPRLWKHLLPDSHPVMQLGMTDDERDAYVIAKALSDADHDGRLLEWCTPALDHETTAIARYEGWILATADPGRGGKGARDQTAERVSTDAGQFGPHRPGPRRGGGHHTDAQKTRPPVGRRRGLSARPGPEDDLGF